MSIQDILGSIPKLETTQDHIDFYMREKRCQCDSCKASAKFSSIINKLTDEDDQKWMLDFMESLCEHDEEKNMEIAHYETKSRSAQNQIDALESLLDVIINLDPSWGNTGAWKAARDRGAFVGMQWENES